MGSIRTSTGLASGIDTATLIKALLVNGQSAISRIQNRQTTLQTSLTGISQLQAGLLSVTNSAQLFTSRSTFQTLQLQNSDPTQLAVTAGSSAVAGTQQFQSVRLATSDVSVSRGFSSSDQALGLSGRLTIATGGRLARPASLELLNLGSGVRRGSIRITDRNGSAATVDLSNALTVDDVLSAINSQTTAAVRATSQGGKIVLEDRSGQTATNLSVISLNGGSTAEDLGIAQSVAATTLTGTDVYQVAADFSLPSINDGNGLRLAKNSADLSIALQDGTTLAVDIDSARTVGDVILKINSHASNGGKVTAALVNNRLELTDTTTGAGTLTVTSATGSNAAQVLGLDKSATANVLSGKALSGGLNSVLLRNLNGGNGIGTLGEISLTDRTGATAIVDLSQAESLDDVLTAINGAATTGSVKLQLQAKLDARGTGLEITDTSGQTASDLVIADVTGTTAADLKIAVSSAVNTVTTGSLGVRTVNEASLLSTYAPTGGNVTRGSFSITNAAGDSAVITLSSAHKTIGDVLDQINAAGINVTAQLSDNGDGFTLVDHSTGAGTLRVQEVGGKTAFDLHLNGTAVTGGDGKQRIVSRKALLIDIVGTDTLQGIATKVASAGGLAKASIVESGSQINPYRLSLTSAAAGTAGQLMLDDGGLGLNFTKQTIGQDAVLRIGGDPATAFLKTSTSNTFVNAVTGYNVSLLKVGTTSASIDSRINSSKISDALSAFVGYHNQLSTQIDTLTKFDTATSARSALQGDATVLQIKPKIVNLVNRVTGAAGAPIRSLADLGVVVGTGGKLTFDAAKFEQTFADHPQEVTDFFTNSTTGFGTRLNATLKDLNDPTSGSLTTKTKSIEAHVKSLQDQIDKTTASLANRRIFLERQFAQMESVLSGLQSQQEALTALSNIATSLTKSDK